MDIFAEIKGIKYKQYLVERLKEYDFCFIERALRESASFILDIDKCNKLAVSHWVSPKRTRSYPYARVYDTLSFSGKRVTIIPVIKDEGKLGDRDFLQWDTISLMSLLGVYVIIAYYSDAERSSKNKITNQKFNLDYVVQKIKELISYKSDALHWNLEQVSSIGVVAELALESYRRISSKLGIDMHSFESARERIEKIKEGKEQFIQLSRGLAERAQHREKVTMQPKEHVSGIKGAITIKNYLGGYYYFTCDEVEIDKNDIYLIEGKHTKENRLPSIGDIKDGLLKMILYTNLENVKVDGKTYRAIPVLKLTTGRDFRIEKIPTSQRKIIDRLKCEATSNRFWLKINNTYLVRF